MKFQRLLEINGSDPLVAIHSRPDRVAEEAWRWQDAGLTVRTVRGGKMRTVGSLFDEMSAALQFPHYFGENWAAFDECLADMDWLPSRTGTVVVILNAAAVLSDEPPAEMSGSSPERRNVVNDSISSPTAARSTAACKGLDNVVEPRTHRLNVEPFC